MADEREPAWAPPPVDVARPLDDERADGRDDDRADGRGRLSRRAPLVQVSISAALALATLIPFFGYWQALELVEGPAAVTVALIFTPFYGACFVASVWAMVRLRARRRLAVIVAAAVAVFDTAYTAYELSPVAAASAEISSGVYTLILTLYVAAWGLARRQHRNWVNGLPLALLVAGVCQIGITPNLEPSWFVFWTLYVGAFVAGCLICWALDVAARRDEAQMADPPTLPG